MHQAALDYTYNTFSTWRQKRTQSAQKMFNMLEIGSLNINGGARELLEKHAVVYVGIDMQEGPGVDIVADATVFSNPDSFDVVICNEVFEHLQDWDKIVQRSMENLRDGGIFIATMAGEGRPPHSAIDEAPIREWEWYDNVGEWRLAQVMNGFFSKSSVNKLGTDLRCWGEK